MFSYLSFPSNFGYQAALMAGLRSCGPWPHVVVTMDSDLEHPLELVPELVRLWNGGCALLVNTMRRENRALPWRKRFASKAFYVVSGFLTGLDIRPGQADFRLWDADFLRLMSPHLERMGSLRLFAAWVRVSKAEIEYDQIVTAGLTSRFDLKRNLSLAFSGLIRFSNLPLRTIGVLGGLGLLVSVLYSLWIAASILQGKVLPGWSSLILTMIFMSCLQLLSMWVLALYLKRLVFDRDFPTYLVAERKGALFDVDDKHAQV